MPWNKTWGLSIELLKATFPHEHYYAEAVQNEFVSIWKWLKIVHKRKKPPFTSDSPLPSDILLNVRDVVYFEYSLEINLPYR